MYFYVNYFDTKPRILHLSLFVRQADFHKQVGHFFASVFSQPLILDF